MEKKLCIVCHEEIPSTRRPQAKYCSEQCKGRKEREKYQTGNYDIKLPTGTTGALSELKVAIDLLAKGHEVFRAMSPACSCDLAVLKDGVLLRLEVKTGHYWCGKLYPAPSRPNQKYDILAIVSPHTNEIIYQGDF